MARGRGQLGQKLPVKGSTNQNLSSPLLLMHRESLGSREGPEASLGAVKREGTEGKCPWSL